jgi:hypothetical protein
LTLTPFPAFASVTAWAESDVPFSSDMRLLVCGEEPEDDAGEFLVFFTAAFLHYTAQ